MSSIATASPNKTELSCVISTALIWIALWFLAEIIYTNLTTAQQIYAYTTLLIIAVMAFQYSTHNGPGH